jgi:hypothetical protein
MTIIQAGSTDYTRMAVEHNTAGPGTVRSPLPGASGPERVADEGRARRAGRLAACLTTRPDVRGKLVGAVP